jgi:uncharacterized protein (TIGR02301 family)
MILRPLTAALMLAASAVSTPASAQDLETYQQRQRDLASLAELFGELHHLRRTCDPRYEADTWRERMKKLLDLEEPQAAEREALIQQFNKGYRAAQSRHPSCDRRARDYAAARAAQGDVVVDRLRAALHEDDEGDFAPSPYPISPAQPQDNL